MLPEQMLPERTMPVQTTSNGNGAVRLVPEAIKRAWGTLLSMSRSRAYPVLGVILALEGREHRWES